MSSDRGGLSTVPIGGRGWAYYADRELAKLFIIGQPMPTKEQIRDAYPFGERCYHPYKVWLARVKAWKTAFAKGLAAPEPTTDYAKAIVGSRSKRKPDTETGDLGL